MFRFFLITLLLFSFEVQAATPESLEKINADLMAKKAQADPFNGKSAKIDLESLGLDEIDAKDNKINAAKAAETTQLEKKETKLPEAIDPKKTNIEKSQLLPPKSDNEKLANTSSGQEKSTSTASDKIKEMQKIQQQSDQKKPITTDPIDKKITKILRQTTEEKSATPAVTATAPQNDKPINTVKKEQQTYVNSTKKANLRKKLSDKKRAEENEKKRKADLTKLNELRKKYLTSLKDNSSKKEGEGDEDFVEVDTKIVPQRKNINKFASYETPAPPIMDRYRSHDNEGIPIVLTNREKADILFRSIGNEDISFFNSAYNDIEDPNLRNNFGDTILTYSILLQKRDVMASILAKGADPNLPNRLGYTPLQITIESLDLPSFNILVNANADVNYVDGFGRTYLMHAARVGFLPAIEILIKKGADVNALDYDGFTALAIANKYKQELAITLLLKYGAKPWVEKPYNPEEESIIKQLDNRWKR